MNIKVYILTFFIFFISCASMKSLYTETKKIKKNIEGNIFLKVLVLKTNSKTKISSDTLLRIENANISPRKEYEINIKNNKIAVNENIINSETIQISSDNNLIKINKKRYRGVILIGIEDNNLVFINKLDIESYLYGVLPAEIAPNWPYEVLKAQAVAARSFAIYNLNKNKNSLYNLSDCVLSQVYSGYNIENEMTNNAVNDTKGEVLIYNNEVIQAFFHANSGGRTASSEEVWGGKLDYLISINDQYSINEKNYKWNYKISLKEIARYLEKNKIITGNIYEMKINNRTESGRVDKIKIYCNNGIIEIKGKDFRNYIGVDKIRSTNFSIQQKNDELFFEGFGWGHGVGLSQEGAKKMAEIGKNYTDILYFYYKGVKLVKFY